MQLVLQFKIGFTPPLGAKSCDFAALPVSFKAMQHVWRCPLIASLPQLLPVDRDHALCETAPLICVAPDCEEERLVFAVDSQCPSEPQFCQEHWEYAMTVSGHAGLCGACGRSSKDPWHAEREHVLWAREDLVDAIVDVARRRVTAESDALEALRTKLEVGAHSLRVAGAQEHRRHRRNYAEEVRERECSLRWFRGRRREIEAKYAPPPLELRPPWRRLQSLMEDMRSTVVLFELLCRTGGSHAFEKAQISTTGRKRIQFLSARLCHLFEEWVAEENTPARSEAMEEEQARERARNDVSSLQHVHVQTKLDKTVATLTSGAFGKGNTRKVMRGTARVL